MIFFCLWQKVKHLRVIAKKNLRDFWKIPAGCEQLKWWFQEASKKAIKFRMEQVGYTQNDLANIVGLKSRASEILNKKRKLSLEMIRKLHESLHIPTDV